MSVLKGDACQRLLVGVDVGQETLSVNRSKLYKLMDSGQLASVRLGTRRMIVRSAISDLIERAMGPTTPTNEASADQRQGLVMDGDVWAEVTQPGGLRPAARRPEKS